MVFLLLKPSFGGFLLLKPSFGGSSIASAGYVGAERENVLKLFNIFSSFPEDVSVPTELFDRLAAATPSLFGMAADSKRPHLKVRSWLTALQRLSLVLGTLAEGFYMHDIVRDFARSRCDDLAALHSSILDAFIAAAPAQTGWPYADGLERGTAGHYVAIHTPWHVRGAAAGSEGEPLSAKVKAVVLRLIMARVCGCADLGAIAR